MRPAVKRFLWIALILLLAFAGNTYWQLKRIGIIPSHDYETVAPEFPALERPAVLVFSKTNGYRHIDTIPVANQTFEELARERGWDVFVTENAAVHNPDVLQHFDLVVWSNVSGDVLTVEQRQSFRDWLAAGGGWLGVHASGGDMEYAWPWYVNELLGAQFIGHTMDPQFQDAIMQVEDPNEVVTGHVPARWAIAQEEWYAFDRSVRELGYEVLLTIDETSYAQTGKHWNGFVDTMEGEHPMVWRHRVGEGRAFYSAIGHQPETYRLAKYRELLGRAMDWTMDER